MPTSNIIKTAFGEQCDSYIDACGNLTVRGWVQYKLGNTIREIAIFEKRWKTGKRWAGLVGKDAADRTASENEAAS